MFICILMTKNRSCDPRNESRKLHEYDQEIFLDLSFLFSLCISSTVGSGAPRLISFHSTRAKNTIGQARVASHNLLRAKLLFLMETLSLFLKSFMRHFQPARIHEAHLVALVKRSRAELFLLFQESFSGRKKDPYFTNKRRVWCVHQPQIQFKQGHT